MNKLVKLRVLDISNCDELTHMPRGMSKLTDLHTLTGFVVGEASSSMELFGMMEDLKALKNLDDFLRIEFPFSKNGVKIEKDSGRDGGYLRDMEHLQGVSFYFGRHHQVKAKTGIERYEEALLEELQPHKNLKSLCIMWYHGMCLPGWAVEDNLATFLPNLIDLNIVGCSRLQYIGSIGNLRNLKFLMLQSLDNLECLIEQGTTSSAKGAIVLLYPSLQELTLWNLPKLNGWEGDSDEFRCLPRLKSLDIRACPSLASSLQCPLLEDLHLEEFNRDLKIVTGVMNTESEDAKGKREEAIVPTLLRVIHIGKVEWLTKLSTRVTMEKEVNDFGDAFHICLSSLKYLRLENCANLTIDSEGLEDLINLENLTIIACPNFSLSVEREQATNIMPWANLSHKLHSLELRNLPQLVNLPQWIQYLTALQYLSISNCGQLTSLPNWMSKLTSLRLLHISFCSATLEERCRDQDWPQIAHIPSIKIIS